MTIQLEYRDAQPYAAVPLKVPIPFSKYLGPAWGEVRTWLGSIGISACGAPFIRYLTDPDQDPDPKKWQTELAFLVND